jgi:Predicted transcriptional regulators
VRPKIHFIFHSSSLEVYRETFYENIYWNGESKNIIGKRLKQLRQQQNISQRILAARLTLSGGEFSDLTILRIERGERFVPDYEIAVIADYFKVSADYLLGRAIE